MSTVCHSQLAAAQLGAHAGRRPACGSVDQLHRRDAGNALPQLLRNGDAHRHHVGSGPRDLDLRQWKGGAGYQAG